MNSLALRTSGWFSHTFSSFRSRNFRLWFLGQSISLVGTWTQAAAQGFLIYQLTGSSAYLGIVSFAAGIPSWFFTLPAGVVADRFPRRTLLMIIQASMVIPAVILAYLAFSGTVQPWHIVVLAFILGMSNAFDAPVRMAFVPELVERNDLVNAIALNGTMFNLAVVIGPGIGGLAYALLGPAWCFAFNAVSFLAVIVALALMSIQYEPPKQSNRQVTFQDMLVGLGYVRGNREVLLLIITIGMLATFGVGVIALMPAWAVEILKGGPETNGLILSFRGLGAFVGSLAVASMGHIHFRGRLWAAGLFIMPVMLLLFSFITWLPLSLAVMMVTGLGFMLAANTSNALVQTRIPDELRGRVMAVYVFVFFGAFPIGSLLAGQMAEYFGEPLAIQFSSVVLIVYLVFLWLAFPFMRKLE